MVIFSLTSCLICLVVCNIVTVVYPLLISNWRMCSSPDELIAKFWGVSVYTCAEECERRPACQVYNYRKKSHSCELLSEEGDMSTELKGCVLGLRLPYNEMQCPCSGGQACNTSDGTCYKNECPPLFDAHATISGNVWTIGSRVRIECKFYQTVSPTAKCQTNGQWADVTTCYPGCPSSSDDFMDIGSQKLKICKYPHLNHAEAELSCGRYGELVRIDTIEKHTAIAATLALSANGYLGQGYWIQGHHDGTWKFNDGSLINVNTFNDVWRDRNGGSSEACIRLQRNRFGMNDAGCSRMFGYICAV